MPEATDRTEKIDMVFEIQLGLEGGTLTLENAESLINTLDLKEVSLLNKQVIRMFKELSEKIVAAAEFYDVGEEGALQRLDLIVGVISLIRIKRESIIQKMTEEKN